MIDWLRIEAFVGYGTIDAPVVFVGPEEHIDSIECLVPELELRSTYEAVMDRADAIGVAGSDSALGKFVPTWKPMNDLMLRRQGIKSPTYGDRQKYQIHELGRSSGKTLLAELLPYPAPNRSCWVYSDLARFDGRDQYEEALTTTRIEMLTRVLRDYKRDVIVCYGKRDWPSYQKLFPEAEWENIESDFLVATGNGTRIVLAHHFSRGFETQSALDRLAETVLAYS